MPDSDILSSALVSPVLDVPKDESASECNNSIIEIVYWLFGIMNLRSRLVSIHQSKHVDRHSKLVSSQFELVNCLPLVDKFSRGLIFANFAVLIRSAKFVLFFSPRK